MGSCDVGPLPGGPDSFARFVPGQAGVSLDANEVGAQRRLGFIETASILGTAAVTDAIRGRIVFIVVVRPEVRLLPVIPRPEEILHLGAIAAQHCLFRLSRQRLEFVGTCIRGKQS